MSHVKFERMGFLSGSTSTDAVQGELRRELVYSGMVAEVKVGEAVAIGKLLYYSATLGLFKIHDADAIATMPVLCMALEAATTTGDFIKVLVDGYFRWDGLDGVVTKASGTITTSGVFSHGDYVTVNDKIYEIDTGAGTSQAGAIAIDGSTAVTQVVIEPLLLAAIVANDAEVACSAWVSHVLTITSVAMGIVGNDITLAKSGTNLAVSAAKLAGGVEGGILYAGLTAGEFSLTAPSAANDVAQKVAFAVAPSEVLFRPSLEWTVGS